MSAVGRPTLPPRLTPSAGVSSPLVTPIPTPLGAPLPRPELVTPIPGPAAAPAVEAHESRTRSALTRRAHRVMRLHLLRAAIRVSVLMAGDAAALLLLRAVMRGVRDIGWLGPTVARITNQLVPQGALPAVQLLPAVLLGLIVLDTYGPNDRRRDAGRLVAGATFGLALPFWGYLWDHFSLLALPGFALLALAISVALVIERQLIDGTVQALWPIGPGAARALVLSRPEDTARALGHPFLADTREFNIDGVYNPDDLRLTGPGGGVASLAYAVRRHRADTLVLAGPMSDEMFGTIIDAASVMGCQVFALPRSLTVAGVEPRLVWRRGAPLVALTRPGLRGRQLLLKRMLDLVGSLAALAILAPAMALIALAIRLDSGGPVLFAQQRMGRAGRPFRCFKFRSMRADAEEQLRRDPALYQEYLQNHFKLPEDRDPRLTKVGRFLRKTSLDELPQLWNVLRGEMSLVGPRPVVPDELDHYGEESALVLSLKPGMTGAWAVNGRSGIGYPDRAEIELAYVREWRLGRDLSILLRTVPAVFRMRGAH